MIINNLKITRLDAPCVSLITFNIKKNEYIGYILEVENKIKITSLKNINSSKQSKTSLKLEIEKLLNA